MRLFDDHAWAESSEIKALVNDGQNRDIFLLFSMPDGKAFLAIGHIQQR